MIPFPILSSTEIPQTLSIKKVAAGADHFAFLTTDGDVYTVGTNTNGQCGNGTIVPVTKPLKVYSGVRDIFCGEKCTFIVTEADGTVLIAGDTTCTGSPSNATIFTARANLNVQKARGVKKICASEKACGIMYTDATLWTCGIGFLGSGYVSSMRTSMTQVAANCYDLSVSTDSMYYRDNNQNLWGVGEIWALNLPTSANNQATWGSQYGGLYRPLYEPELKTHHRCCIFPNTNVAYCVGIATYGQLGNGNTADIQGNRVYPRASMLGGKDLFYNSARGRSYNSMIVQQSGIYFSGRTTTGNSGFPTIPTDVGTYRTIPLDSMLGVGTFDGKLVTSLETNTNCTYMLYNGELYVTGRTYDGILRSVFTLTNIEG